MMSVQSVMQMIAGVETDRYSRITIGVRRSENDNSRPAQRSAATVLVVEDDVLVRVSTAQDLRDAGYRVIEAATAEEAWIAVQTEARIALVFSDIDLPGVWQGTDLARWVRDAAPGVKVILTSSAFHTVAGLKTCDDFVPKPYLVQEIAADVKRLLGR
jgi:DNA-binding response OmpR family regulator